MAGSHSRAFWCGIRESLMSIVSAVSVVSWSAGAESPSGELAYPDVERTTEPGAQCEKSEPKRASRKQRAEKSEPRKALEDRSEFGGRTRACARPRSVSAALL